METYTLELTREELKLIIAALDFRAEHDHDIEPEDLNKTNALFWELKTIHTST